MYRPSHTFHCAEQRTGWANMQISFTTWPTSLQEVCMHLQAAGLLAQEINGPRCWQVLANIQQQQNKRITNLLCIFQVNHSGLQIMDHPWVCSYTSQVVVTLLKGKFSSTTGKMWWLSLEDTWGFYWEQVYFLWFVGYGRVSRREHSKPAKSPSFVAHVKMKLRVVLKEFSWFCKRLSSMYYYNM